MRLLTIITIVGLVVLVGCGGGSTPEQVTKAFWTGVKNSNAETTWSLMSKRWRSSFREGFKLWVITMSQFDSDIKDFKVGKTTISGGTATVPVKLTLFTHESAPTETPYDTELRLIKEGGVWKVDKWVEVHNFNF